MHGLCVCIEAAARRDEIVPDGERAVVDLFQPQAGGDLRGVAHRLPEIRLGMHQREEIAAVGQYRVEAVADGFHELFVHVMRMDEQVRVKHDSGLIHLVKGDTEFAFKKLHMPHCQRYGQVPLVVPVG